MSTCPKIPIAREKPANRASGEELSFHLKAEAVALNQPVQLRRMSYRDRGNGFAFNSEVNAMWFLPVSVTLEMKRTRTSWLLVIRVHFIL